MIRIQRRVGLTLVSLAFLFAVLNRAKGWWAVRETVARAEQSMLDGKVSLAGSILPRHQVTIRIQPGERVESFVVREGDPVRAGQVVATMGDPLGGAEVDAARYGLELARSQEEVARLAVDEASVSVAEIDAMRQGDLFALGLVSKADVERARAHSDGASRAVAQQRAAYGASHARVAEASAQLRRAISNAERRTIRAPVAGEVIQVFAGAGETAVTSPTADRTALMTIASSDDATLKASATASQVRSLLPGQRAVLDTGETGAVEFVARLGTLNADGALRFEVRILLDKRDGHRLWGLPAIAIIGIAPRQISAVPWRCVRGSEADAHVLLADGSRRVRQSVSVESVDRGVAKVDGLRVGALVSCRP